jgi:hypothetical protein
MNRREFLKRSGSVAVAALAADRINAIAKAQADNALSSGAAVVIDPKPLFEISPHLYMQFMEPLGVTDSSVHGMTGARIS